jgi:hypothetical protein
MELPVVSDPLLVVEEVVVSPSPHPSAVTSRRENAYLSLIIATSHELSADGHDRHSKLVPTALRFQVVFEVTRREE